jgi:hypothetical protein
MRSEKITGILISLGMAGPFWIETKLYATQPHGQRGIMHTL